MTVSSFDPVKPLSVEKLGSATQRPTAPAPQKPPTHTSPAIAADQFQGQPLQLSAQQPVVSHLQVHIEDKDGLANFGAQDIKATVSGDIAISSQFLLSKLSQLKSNKEKQFHPPTFDAKRQQYVIKGTALNKILGLLDIGFEIRLGAVKGQLAFRVDSGLKRGAIYDDLTKMLKEQGLTTYEQDGLLFIKPQYDESITLPALGDQPARIDKVGATPQNLQFEIATNGQIKVHLKQVPVEMSSQVGVSNPRKATPDTAMLKVNLGFDQALKPTAQIVDGQVKAQAGATEINKYLPTQSQSLLTEQLGTALTVGLTGLRGQVHTGNDGLLISTSGQVSVKNLDGSAQVSAGLNAALRGGKPVITAQQADIQLKNGTQITAAKVEYDGRQPGLDLKVQGLDGQLHHDGVQVKVQDLSGRIKRSQTGPLQATITGTTQGQIEQNGVKAQFSTSGSHQVSVQGKQIKAEVDRAEVVGSYQPKTPSDQPEKPTAKGKAQQISLSVKDIKAVGKVTTPTAVIDAQASQGSLQLNLGEGVSVKTTAQLHVSAQGEKVSGKAVLPNGAAVNLDNQGLKVKLTHADIQGKFDKPQKLKVEGQIQGNVDVAVSPTGAIKVETSGGQFDAKFALKDKVKITGKGEQASLSLDAQENIALDLEKMQATTEVTAGKTRVKAKTTGAKAHVSVINDDVTVQTTRTRSTLDVNVNSVLKGSGTTGDVTVKVDSQPQGDDIKIMAQQADVKAQIQNKKGNLQVGINAKANIQVGVDSQDNVTVSSTQAQSKVDVKLTSPDGKQEKIKVQAQGNNFNVNVGNDDNVAVELQKSQFKGAITPNSNIAVDVETTQAATLKLNIDESQPESKITIQTPAAVKGNVKVEDKISASFNNPSGFAVNVTDKATGTDVHTQLKDLTLKGRVQTADTQVGVDGKGNFDLKIINDEDVQISYDGHLLGDLQAQQKVAGHYGLSGKVQVDVQGKDVDIKARGSVQGSFNSPDHGVGADVQVNGQSSPIRVQIKDQQLALDIKEGGQIQVKDLKQLKLGQPDPKLNDILNKLESENVGLNYSDLEVKGEKAHVKLATDTLKTVYGDAHTEMELEKRGDRVYVTQGAVAFAPNLKFYELIQEQINQKFNIKLSGTPSFENGELKLKGEVRSKLGLVQWANFNIKATVVDNKLVFDLDKAKVLKVIGKGTIGTAADALLSKTDIDVFRKAPGRIEISLADIAKDLALTEGVNFTDLKMVNNRFEVGFRYDSQDSEVARLAKKKDVAGLKSYMAAQTLADMSGESISTVYNTYVTGKDVDAASQLLLKTLQAYQQSYVSDQLERALLWMTKNHAAQKSDINDDIALAVLKQVRLDSPTGQALVAGLPLEVVRNLADSLDKTISQGGGFSWITPEEREMANRLRKMKGLPLNQRMI